MKLDQGRGRDQGPFSSHSQEKEQQQRLFAASEVLQGTKERMELIQVDGIDPPGGGTSFFFSFLKDRFKL